MHYRRKEMATKHCNLVSHETSMEVIKASIVPIDEVRHKQVDELTLNPEPRTKRNLTHNYRKVSQDTSKC